MIEESPQGNKGKGIGGHTLTGQGATDIWLTPRHVLNALGEFDLDPCAAPDPTIWTTAKCHYTENGLTQKWFGRVWCNPPYGKQTGTWLNRLADHGTGVALIFARTETEMFFESVWNRADAILFLEGRLFFHYPNGARGKSNSGGPSCLIAYGKSDVEVLRTCTLKGQFVTWDRKTPKKEDPTASTNLFEEQAI